MSGELGKRIPSEETVRSPRFKIRNKKDMLSVDLCEQDLRSEQNHFLRTRVPDVKQHGISFLLSGAVHPTLVFSFVRLIGTLS